MAMVYPNLRSVYKNTLSKDPKHHSQNRLRRNSGTEVEFPNRPIGLGATGSVFAGKIAGSGLSVAVKVIPARDVRFFSNEVRFLCPGGKPLDHPNIIRVIKFGEHVDLDAKTVDGHIIEELADKDLSKVRSCRDLIGKPGDDNIDKLLNFLEQILNAEIALAKQNTTHNDIKTENILLVGDRYKLTDFSHATYLNEARQVGTARVTAPEILLGKETAKSNCKSDIFSIGVTTAEIITGKNIWLFGEEQVDIEKCYKAAPFNYVLQKVRYDMAVALNVGTKSSVGKDKVIELIMSMIAATKKGRPSSEKALEIIHAIQQQRKQQVAQRKVTPLKSKSTPALTSTNPASPVVTRVQRPKKIVMEPRQALLQALTMYKPKPFRRDSEIKRVFSKPVSKPFTKPRPTIDPMAKKYCFGEKREHIGPFRQTALGCV